MDKETRQYKELKIRIGNRDLGLEVRRLALELGWTIQFAGEELVRLGMEKLKELNNGKQGKAAERAVPHIQGAAGDRSKAGEGGGAKS